MVYPKDHTGIRLHILGMARDLRTDTAVVYAQIPISDYLKWISGFFDAFEIQRRRTWHPSYQRMKSDLIAGALLPTITLTVTPERVPELLPLLNENDRFSLTTEMAVPGCILILDGFQRSLILRDLASEGHRFHPAQTVHAEIWIEPNIYNLIYRVLVLNSAYKPMPMRHQFKLIFLTLKYRLETDIHGLELYRKIPGVRQDRRPGMYLLDQVITAFLCFLMKTPEISRENVEAQEKVLREIFESESRELGNSFERFAGVLKHYKEIDKEISRVYRSVPGIPDGNRWIGSENVMKAFFAAAAQSGSAIPEELLNTLQSHIASALTGEDLLGLHRLKQITDRIDPRKFNVNYATRSILLAGFKGFFMQGGRKPIGKCWPEDSSVQLLLKNIRKASGSSNSAV